MALNPKQFGTVMKNARMDKNSHKLNWLKFLIFHYHI